MIHRTMIIGLLLAILSAFPAMARDQSGDNWYFGHNGGVTFVNGTPEPLAGGQINQSEGCASISDSSGNLLFYTDGIDIWDATHAKMTNGQGLKGNPSATQSAVVVPHPGDSDLYYVFTVPALNSSDGLNYSVVDMSLNSGNGDVVSGQKNLNLMSTCSEQITAVAHANSSDIWVLARPYNSNAFYAFLVESSGIDTTPVVSNAGTTISSGGDVGYLKGSVQGDRLAMASYLKNAVELYDFDNSTGQVSNAQDLGVTSGSPYGIEFSPDGSKLYYSAYGGSKVYQFNLDAGDIPGSKTSVGNASVAALQLGPDGKIYGSAMSQSYLSVINEPNETGTSCDFQAVGPSISGACSAGLPTFIQTFFAQSADKTTMENTPLAFASTDFTTPYNDATSQTLGTVKFTELPTLGNVSIQGIVVTLNQEVAAADLIDVVYTPDAYTFGTDGFKWQGKPFAPKTADGPRTQGQIGYDFNGTYSIDITPVAQQPAVTLPTDPLVDVLTTDGLVITPNSNDGAEVTHFNIFGISGGALYQSDGATTIADGAFITSAEGAAGLHFLPSQSACSFVVAGATGTETADVSADTKTVSFTALDTPDVANVTISKITPTSASVSCEITADNGANVTSRGVCWNTSGSPTTSDPKSSNGTGTGTFNAELQNLTPGTTYHVSGYGVNSIGTAYGTVKQFTTPPDADGDGTADDDDGCPDDPSKTSAGACGCGKADTDTDEDGTADCDDQCPNDADKTAPGTCGCGKSDEDADSDGTPDCNDACADDPNKTSPDSCGCGVADVDTDLDGTLDCHDTCPSDPAKTQAGVCGCGVADVDTDNDGTLDCEDGCPNDSDKTQPGNAGCGEPEIDKTPNLKITITQSESGESGDGGNGDSQPNNGDSGVDVGDEVDFMVDVENIGDGDANNVVVNVPLPPQMEFISARILSLDTGQSVPNDVQVFEDHVEIDLGHVPPGSNAQIELKLRAKTSGAVNLEASAQSDEVSEPVKVQEQTEVKVNDQYTEIITTTQVPMCGLMGFVPLMLTAVWAGICVAGIKRR